MTIHVGILGGGNISKTHARAASEVQGVTIAAVCGQNAEKVRHLAESYGASTYADLDSFLTHKPMDMVLIGSPSGLHAEQGIAAAHHGLHILVEKPVAITTEQAENLIAACEQAGVKLGVFFQDRTAPDILKLKDIIDSGKLGKLILVSARVKWYRSLEYYSNSRWRGTWALDGGGALMNQGIHTVDLLLWLMGNVRSVWAKAITALHDIEVEDILVAGIEFSNGAIGTLEVATSVYPGFSRRLELTGSQGTIILENDRLLSADLLEPWPELSDAPTMLSDVRSVSPVISNTSGHRRIIEDFLQAIASNRQPLCDGHQGRLSVELVQAMYESSQTGQVIGLCRSNR
jgi:predicted dehydrogenase